jgi:DivIVA domain-containing protein
LLDQSDIEMLRSATFPRSWAWRGYDRAEVEKFLAALADRLDREPGAAQRPSGEPGNDTELIETLEATIGNLEREVANANRREKRLADNLEKARRDTKGGREAPPPARTSRRTGRRAASRRGPIDVNRATFSQLRDLGLGVTDAARLTAVREIRGGFQSLDELDEIEGFSPTAIRRLKHGVYVDDAGRTG